MHTGQLHKEGLLFNQLYSEGWYYVAEFPAKWIYVPFCFVCKGQERDGRFVLGNNDFCSEKCLNEFIRAT